MSRGASLANNGVTAVMSFEARFPPSTPTGFVFGNDGSYDAMIEVRIS